MTLMMGNMKLLCMPFSVIGPHLTVRGKSQNFSRVLAGLWVIFSSYGRDGNSKFVCSAKSVLLSNYEGHISNLHEAYQCNTDDCRCESGD